LHFQLQASFITEIILQDIWKNYVQENNWFLNCIGSLKEQQFWCTKGLSTDKALYKFMDGILCALNDEMHVSEIFCDLVDCVIHDITIKIKYI
jgi:hypothetical protein